MGHVELAALVAASYGGSLVAYRRVRLLLGRRAGLRPEQLRGITLETALGPLLRRHPTLAKAIARARAGEPGAAALDVATLGLAPTELAWARSAFALFEAERTRGTFGRYRIAARARRLARFARRSEEPAALYLWAAATLGYLTDWVNLELVHWHTGVLLTRALKRHPEEPLLHLAMALRASVQGDPAETFEELGRALYHAGGRGDRSVAQRLLSLPELAELAPGLWASARQLTRSDDGSVARL
ncbi:MAG: hypothetical protein ACYCWW_02585 [Deltaproteobacteria bacterium]